MGGGGGGGGGGFRSLQLGMSSFNLYVRVFVITLYPTLQRFMGRNCEIISRCFTLGIRIRSVSFAFSDSEPV